MIPAGDLPGDVLDRLTAPRADLLGLSMATPQIMGIINATPDSFSDGALYEDVARAADRIRAMIAEGASITPYQRTSSRVLSTPSRDG